MNHSVEVRPPLVDAHLLRELAPLLAGPSPPTKHDMARSPLSPLPGSVLDRPKTGFSIPVRKWLLDEDSGFARHRGLRGWTRLVHSVYLSGRHDSLYVSRAAMRRRSASPSSTVTRPSRNVLVFRIGQLGDTVAALPAIMAVRNHYRDGRFTLLCDRHPGKPYVFGPDLLRGSGLFNHFEFYPVRDRGMGRLLQAKDMLALLRRLKNSHYDTLVYLSPSARSRRQIARDVRFFRAAGIKEIIGTDGFAAPPKRTPGQPLEAVPHESELLLARMAASGIPVPPPGQGCMDLNLGAPEEAEVNGWLDSQTTGSRDHKTASPLPSDGRGIKGEGLIVDSPVVSLSRSPVVTVPSDHFLDRKST